MKRTRFGLQGHFLLVSAVALAMVLAIVALLVQRQSALQRETDKASRDVIHELYEQNLRDRGQSLAKMLADALRNPVYYADLDEIGSIVRGVRGQDNIGYGSTTSAAGWSATGRSTFRVTACGWKTRSRREPSPPPA